MNHRFASKLAISSLAVAMLVAAGCSSGSKAPAAPQLPKISVEEAPKVRQEAADLISKGNLEEANTKLQQVTEATPKDATAHFLLAITLYNKKQYKEAVDAYKKAVELNPNYFEAYNNMGNAYRDNKQVDEAITAYKKAIELNPKFVFPYTNLSALYDSNGKQAESISILEQGAKSTDSMDLKLTLAVAYKDAGMKDKAQQIVDELQKVNPSLPGLKEVAESLKK